MVQQEQIKSIHVNKVYVISKNNTYIRSAYVICLVFALYVLLGELEVEAPNRGLWFVHGPRPPKAPPPKALLPVPPAAPHRVGLIVKRPSEPPPMHLIQHLL